MFAETHDVCAACLKFENDIKQQTVELDMQVQLCYIVEQYFVSVLIINVLYRKMVKIIKMNEKKYFWPSKQKTCHLDTIRWAIEFYCLSPSAYEHVRNSEILALPTPSTIRSYR